MSNRSERVSRRSEPVAIWRSTTTGPSSWPIHTPLYPWGFP
jgi:hypothetical protein